MSSPVKCGWPPETRGHTVGPDATVMSRDRENQMMANKINRRVRMGPVRPDVNGYSMISVRERWMIQQVAHQSGADVTECLGPIAAEQIAEHCAFVRERRISSRHEVFSHFQTVGIHVLRIFEYLPFHRP